MQPGRSARDAGPARIPFSAMRTRRIAIGCRRTGWASSVAVAPDPVAFIDPLLGSFLEPAPLEATPLNPAPVAWTPSPLPSRVPGAARADGPQIPTPAAPPEGEQDLTLADLTTGRRDLSWNDNTGWPNQIDIDWTRIARGHSPKHARRRARSLQGRAIAWTGVGVITAVLLTVMITTISELLR